MYAIFRDGSKQFRAEKGATLQLDRQSGKEGDQVEFPEVVLLHDGQKARIGAPVVQGAKVVAQIVKNFRGDKIRVFKYRRREGYHRTRGHRSELSLVKITDIVAPKQ
jgi:large subunit ribosomal protein L21